MEKPTFDEIRHRIQEAERSHGGKLPKDLAEAWGGYIAALTEWGLISVDDHARLVDLLPAESGFAAAEILCPRER